MTFLDLDEELIFLGYVGSWDEQQDAVFLKRGVESSRLKETYLLDGPKRKQCQERARVAQRDPKVRSVQNKTYYLTNSEEIKARRRARYKPLTAEQKAAHNLRERIRRSQARKSKREKSAALKAR